MSYAMARSALSSCCGLGLTIPSRRPTMKKSTTKPAASARCGRRAIRRRGRSAPSGRAAGAGEAAGIFPAEDLTVDGVGEVGERFVLRAVALAGREGVEHGGERVRVEGAERGVAEDEPVVVPVDRAGAEGVREGAEDGEDDQEEI